jgi:hypothetical protein
MYDYEEYNESDLQSQENNVYAEQAFCFRAPGGRICRDPRRDIECFYPRFGRPRCRRIFRGPGFRPF